MISYQLKKKKNQKHQNIVIIFLNTFNDNKLANNNNTSRTKTEKTHSKKAVSFNTNHN